MSMTFKRYGVAEKRMAAALRFLNAVLANGPVPGADRESNARAAGLRGERQEITNAKLFKAAKKDLGVRSERTGFGPKGEWAWACSTPTETNLVETAADPARLPTTPDPTPMPTQSLRHARIWMMWAKPC